MEDNPLTAASSYRAPLSARERQLLASWERERRVRLTRAELVDAWGTSTASDIAKGLLRKGVLQRAGRGVYLVVPLRAQLRPTHASAAVFVAALLADEPYYLGGLWALSLHGLTQQQYGSRIDAFVVRWRKPRRLGDALVYFHSVPPTAFGVGVETIDLEGMRVRISTKERTIIDALDAPDGVGGLRSALQLVSPALTKVDARRLVALAAELSRVSTCQRLGLLLERQRVPSRDLAPLRRRVRENRSVVSMLPDAPRRGRVHPVWRAVENDR